MQDAIRQSPARHIPQGTSALTALRQATEGRHRVLEALDTLKLPLQLDRYVQALQGFEIFLAAWEPLVMCALPIRLHEWFALRSRRALARNDLHNLDRGPIAEVDLRENCSRLVRRIDLANVASAFGSMYVLEGSCLGGQVIARSAREVHNIGAANATYFSGSGSATARDWREFLALLEAELTNDAQSQADASRSAQQTFDALIGIFTALRDAPSAR